VTGPSPHLSWAELACKDSTPYPREWRASRALVLADMFEAVRARVGRPLVILSAYRTLEHNRRVGGARYSQHVEGRALDLRPPRGWTVARLVEAVREVPQVRGIGIYPSFLHIDCRPSPWRVTWSGGRPHADRR
jgi:uncharacterized protein YcbK (DUF882 family)